MKWYRDTTGRFAHRPHFEPQELEEETWRAATSFHREKYGRSFRAPWSTEDLGCLIEQRAESLDLYADLRSREGPDVEGLTWFRRGHRPKVEIDAALTQDPRRENRLRMTLAHEFTHVLLHGPLWEMHWDAAAGPSLFVGLEDNLELRSVTYRGRARSGIDWMEWQASYGAGALLAPARLVRICAKDAAEFHGVKLPTFDDADALDDLVEAVARGFTISREAALVRLKSLRLVRPARERAQGSLEFTES